MEARYDGKCSNCNGHVAKGDEIRFANKKIVACTGCGNFAPLILGSENGVGWIWAYRLGNNVMMLRAIYKSIRAAYLALAPSVDGWANRTENRCGNVLGSIRGIVGRRSDVDSVAAFDAAIAENIAKEVKDWAGVESFDRLSVGQLHCLHAAWIYVHAATEQTWLEPSPETLEAGGFLGGEMLNFTDEAEKAIDAMVKSAFRL